MNNTIKLFIFFISCIALWFVTVALRIIPLWFVIMNIISVYIIFRYKTFNKKDSILGIVFGVLCIPSSLIMGISVILPYIASMMIFRSCSNRIYLFKNSTKNNLLVTVVLIIVIGGVLGGINVFLAKGSLAMNISFKFKWILDALRAGIFEEIAFRLFFFALCIYIIKNQPISKFQNIICYAIMVIPHVLIHFNFETFDIMNVIVLSILFGLPFALMQRKCNLISAIGSHAFVDFIRFVTFGI